MLQTTCTKDWIVELLFTHQIFSWSQRLQEYSMISPMIETLDLSFVIYFVCEFITLVHVFNVPVPFKVRLSPVHLTGMVCVLVSDNCHPTRLVSCLWCGSEFNMLLAQTNILEDVSCCQPLSFLNFNSRVIICVVLHFSLNLHSWERQLWLISDNLAFHNT